MDVTKYIDELGCYHSNGFTFDYKINWNVSAIANAGNANGYIVQHFKRVSEPCNFMADDTEYYEAWKVEDGVCLDRGTCDDEFLIRSSEGLYAIRSALHTKGYYRIAARVYWIPFGDPLYDIVDQWSSSSVPQTAGLKGSYRFNELTNDYLVFDRPVFTHSWSLLTVDEIEEGVRGEVFHICPNNTKRDADIMKDMLACIFDGQDAALQEAKQRIATAWYHRWN